MFESWMSKSALAEIVEKNKSKAKHYGERLSMLKNCDCHTELGMSNMQVNLEMERCNKKMLQCDKRIRTAEKYL